MTKFRIMLIGIMHSLLLVAVSPAQESQTPPRPVPPPPLPSPDVLPILAGEGAASLLLGQDAELEALTEDERAQIFTKVDLNLKRAAEFTIRMEPKVYLDEADMSRGFIEPPPMQANDFDVGSDSITLHLFLGNGVESPYYTPVAPFCYPPLYFEDPYLERYGDACCCPVQSLLSGVKFYSDVALLPMKMLCEPPCQPVLNLWADPVDEAWK